MNKDKVKAKPKTSQAESNARLESGPAIKKLK